MMLNLQDNHSTLILTFEGFILTTYVIEVVNLLRY